MGLDYSLHPVDPELFRERLVPYAIGRGDISDLIDQAIQIQRVTGQAAAWARAAFDLSRTLKIEQEAVAPVITRHAQTPSKRSLLDSLLGRQAAPKIESFETAAYSPGIPALNTDLHIWGRPFFNTADGLEAALAAHRDFLMSAGQPPERAEALCHAMLDDLDKRRLQSPHTLEAPIIAKIKSAPPYVTALKREAPTAPFDTARVQKGYAAHWIFIREVWNRRAHKGPFDLTALERESRIAAGLPPEEENPGWVDVSENAEDRTNLVTSAQMLSGLPFEIMKFAAGLMPGWMGGGRAHASSAFAEIGVDTGDIFEKPTPLFSEMVSAENACGRNLRRGLADNFSLGAYVRPENMQRLIGLLEKHEHQLVRAWVTDPSNTFQMEDGMTSHLKNLEPAMLAASKGWGYIEAAEIYSGFLGMTN